MKSRSLALIICALATLGIAGCGSNEENPPPAAAAAPPPAPAPAPAPTPAPPPPAMPANLTPAQQRVAKLQMALNSNGAQLNVDGKMGPSTVAALKDYQKGHNLKVTGKADAATMKALGS